MTVNTVASKARNANRDVAKSANGREDNNFGFADS